MIALVILALLQAGHPPAQPSFDRLAARAAEAHKAGRESDALRLYQEALRAKPSWSDGWWNVGSILYGREDFAGAQDALRRLIALDKKAVAGYALLGICEYKVRNYDAAFEHLDTARSLGLPHDHPLGTAGLYYLAVLLNRQGQNDLAAEILLNVPQEQASSPAFLVAIGMAGLRSAKLPEDLTDAEKDLAVQVGRALAERRETEATALMRDLLAAHPDQANLHYLYGMVLMNGDTGAALDQFQKELARDPRHVPSLLAIIREMERQSRFEEALRYAQRAVESDPNQFATHAILGRVLVSMDRAEEGLRELELAKGMEPGSPQIYFTLATAYAKLGRNADAEKARAEFLRLKNLGAGQQ